MKQNLKQLIAMALALVLAMMITIPASAVETEVETVEAVEIQTTTDNEVYDEEYDDEDYLYAGYEDEDYEDYDYEDYEYYDDFDYDEYINEEIEECGGVAGQINVKYNGKCIAFTDAAPEITNDRTMVPLRAIMEALGAEVEYQGDQTVALVDGDISMSMKAGDTTVTVTDAGDSQEITMDTVSYIKNDRTYVPLRFVSEVFGCGVYWDDEYETVILTDKDAMIEDVNEKLSILNLFYQSQLQEEDVYSETNGEFELDIEIEGDAAAFSPIDKLNIDGSMKSHEGRKTATVDLAINFGQLADLIDIYKADMLAGTDSENDRMESLLEDLKENLKNSKFSLKLNQQGEMYMQAELVDIIMMIAEEYTDEELTNAWYVIETYQDMDEMKAPETLGEFAYMMFDMQMQQPYASSFYMYEEWTEALEEAVKWVGDDTFEKRSDQYTWRMDKARIIEMLDESEDENEEVIKFDILFRFNEEGSIDYKFDMEVVEDGERMTAQVECDVLPTKSVVTGSLDIENTVEVDFEGSTSTRKVRTAPNTNLPASATIIDLNEF